MSIRTRAFTIAGHFFLSTRGFVWLCFLFLFLLILSWYFDDKPPAIVTGKITYTGQARPNSDIIVRVPISGDLTRNCHLIYSRNLIDSHGVKFDLVSNTYVSHRVLLQMKEKHPGELLINIRIPSNVSEGLATVNFVNSWMCNPWQWLWPMDTVISFSVAIEK